MLRGELKLGKEKELRGRGNGGREGEMGRIRGDELEEGNRVVRRRGVRERVDGL